MLSQSCEILSGVGPALAGKLEKCGIKTISDLIFHLPFRYQDRTRVTAICDLRPNDYAVIAGRVCKTEVKYGKRMMLYCYVEDKTALIKLRFFHFNKNQVKALQSGQLIRAFGEVREFSQQLEMIHPEYRLLEHEQDMQMEETLTPIYPATEGLSQTRLRQLIKAALTSTRTVLQALEWMSEQQLAALNFSSINDSLMLLHQPPPDVSLNLLEEGKHPAMQRLAFEELLAQRLSMQFARRHRSHLSAPGFKDERDLKTKFIQQLPYPLTAAQLRVDAEIALDLTAEKPMLRLVQGDVGCGKTTVAALASLQAIANGYQVAFMAPTDLLSEQHFFNFQRWFALLGIPCMRLSGKMKAKERRETLQSLLNHDCHLLIGTHALFQENVEFARLGLVIIDEQHRFGVEQRLSLQQKGQVDSRIPHQLLMTATPIPRTLAMTQFAHLDISIIDELPPGRIPVQTVVINQDKREPIIQRLEAAIASGAQAYWVCTLIEESEKLQCMAATVTAENLQAQLPSARIGLVHGRMKAIEKEATMDAFKQGEINLLVATTVIEVGVDVPNASVMIIENAERLGLSQLHQLRGRVGRGNNQSFCILLYQTPVSQLGAERLRVMKATNDGFVIAEKDLQLRGSGEILGTRQTGYRQFKIANLQRDAALLPQVAETARGLMQESADTAEEIAARWLGNFKAFIHS
ncbi:ATP-dependent DNA helicase RecG [Legionella birminghamensis]|uniref:ATP-dependent DNA helicase RecG n=1 Tax=Legionella birminghamensis TaxID=28083 RepID=A0A378I6Y0_9GAMM|nr:ATP-dependent DNA helicase RecG [Legionella birminghamensis]KTC68319.1 ATP-dependent DNA helicase RecG [Legionella birminghamensis]STX30968.1 ATP-dependent DNA helicase RecG [Legionella birminghamensis]